MAAASLSVLQHSITGREPGSAASRGQSGLHAGDHKKSGTLLGIDEHAVFIRHGRTLGGRAQPAVRPAAEALSRAYAVYGRADAQRSFVREPDECDRPVRAHGVYGRVAAGEALFPMANKRE